MKEENSAPIFSFSFPRIKFWDKSSPQLNLVNSADSNVDEILCKLELKSKLEKNQTKEHSLLASMASCDRTEILSRQETFRYLHTEPELSSFASEKKIIELPLNEEQVLDLYTISGKSSFTRSLEKLQGILQSLSIKDKLVGKFAKLLDFIEESKTEYLNAENELVKKVKEEIGKSSRFFGSCNLSIEVISSEDIQARTSNSMPETESSSKYESIGFKKFSQHEILGNKILRYKDYKNEKKLNVWFISWFFILSCIFYPLFFLDNLFYTFIGVLPALYVFGYNFVHDYRSMQTRVIKGAPMSIIEDIKSYLDKNFIPVLQDELNNLLKKTEDGKNFIDFSLQNEIFGERYEKLKIDLGIAFMYKYNGLSIRIVKVNVSPSEHSAKLKSIADFGGRQCEFYFSDDDEYYPFDKKKKLKQNLEKVQKEIFENSYKLPVHAFITDLIARKFKNLVNDNFFVIDSGKTDRKYAYYSLGNVYGFPDIYPYYNSVLKYRDYFGKIFADLKEMNSLLQSLVKNSDIWNIKLEFPEILEDTEHIIGFETIYPVHLIGRKKLDGKELKAEEIVPINSLPPLNGSIIGLSGANAGGKTTVANALADLIFFAQSGLPVFGTGVRLNTKKMLGLIFDEGSKGDSKARRLLEKSKNVFEELEKLDKNSSVVIVDELGGGTQTADGVEIGTKVLAYLNRKGVSVIFNTHLVEVAKYNEENLGGINFKIDRNHQISRGIGKGEIMKLANELGMDKYLSIS